MITDYLDEDYNDHKKTCLSCMYSAYRRREDQLYCILTDLNVEEDQQACKMWED